MSKWVSSLFTNLLGVSNPTPPVRRPAEPVRIKREDSPERPLRRPNATLNLYSANATGQGDAEPSFRPLRRHNAFIEGIPCADHASSTPAPPQRTVKIEDGRPRQHRDAFAKRALAAQRRAFLDQLAPSADYQPRQYIGAYKGDTLPPKLDPELERVRAEVEQPRSEEEAFSLQMIIPDFRSAKHWSHLTLPLAAFFVPADQDLPCGVVESPAPRAELLEATQHIAATLVPQEEMFASLTALNQRFDERRCQKCYDPVLVDVRDESELVSVERNPDNIDDNWVPNRTHFGWYGCPAHKVSNERMLGVVGDAVREVDSKERLRPGIPFYLNVVATPEVLSCEGVVIFVPDDPSIPARGTQTHPLVHTSKPMHLSIKEYSREVRREWAPEWDPEVDGKWEILGRHKRRWVADDGAAEGQSTLKRICGMKGRDTITRHSLLDMEVDNTWLTKTSVKKERIGSSAVKKERQVSVV